MDIVSFWERVKYLIKTHKTTQPKIAELIGMPPGTFRNWIYHNRIPDVETACDLAAILGVTVDFLVYGKERDMVEERNSRLLERKTAAATINRMAKIIVRQSKQI
ncbi:MAG: helix-turn-helix domain-containing protein [Treponema sp.]|nr:helix-turn-helix domain-containing protein [Treponema sp.]